MKKYLLIGLAILIGTNLAALSGVAYNRFGELTSNLALTERELLLAHNVGAQKENSGMSLTINWRTPSKTGDYYYPNNATDISITKEELMALGFKELDKTQNNWPTPLELYWALEFDGALHKVEVNKAIEKHKAALLVYEEQASDNNKREEKRLRDNLTKERTSKSRLFFIEAAKNYEVLASKYNGQKNILIVKGLARYSYNSNDKTYSLSLNDLSVSNIMIPLEYIDIFSGLKREGRNVIQPPRYEVNIHWGARLEPWIVGTKKLTH